VSDTPSRFWMSCYGAMFGCVIAGVQVRQVAVQIGSETLGEVSNAVLFLPCTLAAVWAAWILGPSPRNLKSSSGSLLHLFLMLAVCCICRFFVASYPSCRNLPAIDGYCSPVVFWLTLQSAHWLGFFLVAAGIAKILQWSTGIGVCRLEETACRAKPLSLASLGLIVTLCALAAIGYQRWFISFSSGIVRTENSPAWYQFFPVGSRPWAAGLVGGLLLPIHWLAIVAILHLTRRLNVASKHSISSLSTKCALLGLWCLLGALLQVACSKFYFGNLILPEDSWSRWTEYSVGQPYIVPAFFTLDDPPLAFYFFKSAVQIGLVLVAIYWMARIGYRTGFYPDRLKVNDL